MQQSCDSVSILSCCKYMHSSKQSKELLVKDLQYMEIFSYLQHTPCDTLRCKQQRPSCVHHQDPVQLCELACVHVCVCDLDAESLVNLILDWKTVTVPTKPTLNMETTLSSIACYNVLHSKHYSRRQAGNVHANTLIVPARMCP